MSIDDKLKEVQESLQHQSPKIQVKDRKISGVLKEPECSKFFLKLNVEDLAYIPATTQRSSQREDITPNRKDCRGKQITLHGSHRITFSAEQKTARQFFSTPVQEVKSANLELFPQPIKIETKKKSLFSGWCRCFL